MNQFVVTFNLLDIPEIHDFIGREREIAEIHQSLSSDGGRRIAILHGLGGIGKTQLAVTYIKRYRDKYSAIFWLNIKDEISIQDSFIKVASQIVQQHPDASSLGALNLQKDRNEVIEAVKAWLSLPNNTKWLLVYDNYDNPKSEVKSDGIDIEQYLPGAFQGSMIITTRLSDIDIGQQIAIRKLEAIEDSLEILATTSHRDNVHSSTWCYSFTKLL